MTPDSTVPSDTDRLAEIQARLDAFHLHAGRPPWDEHVSRNRDALERNAPGDLAYLLGELDDAQRLFDALGSEAAEELKAAHATLTSLQGRLDTAEGQLATARQQQLCTVVGAYVAWEIDNDKRNDLPITHSIADKSEGKLRGAMAAFQELLVAIGEIEGDEDLEGVWEVVESAMADAKGHEIRACTGCGKCDYCTARGITAASVLGLGEGDGQ